MEIFALKASDDDDAPPFYVNAAHIISVTGDDQQCEMFVTGGKSYQIEGKFAKKLRSYLDGKVKLILF